MALEIEDGTGKANSNSYVTVVEARAYATARGVSLPATDEEVEALLIRAADYLEAQRSRYQGTKTTPGVQAMQWPRTGVTVDCDYALPSTGAASIPAELKNAQCQYVLELQAGINLLQSTDGRIVKRRKVDVIETEYATGQESGTSGTPTASSPAVEALLSPLFNACGSGFALQSVRI